MKLGLGCCLLVTLGLVSCGGTTGSATLSGNNPATTATVGSNLLTTGGFGYYNVAAAANVQTGGIIPTSRNGQIVARFEF